ncbi:MAG TPA: hypothetical protein VHL11_02595 [Phototrophicaceae bacterium]|jgi:hypothetical protein|nr:hypothetical protein [Phototrophicaceae bacterium]
MDLSLVNLILDFVLVAASIWMVVEARGIGGIIGTSMNRIVIGAIILGFAHLIATFGTGTLKIDPTTNNFIHRLIVLAGFVLLVAGFRKMSEIKR